MAIDDALKQIEKEQVWFNENKIPETVKEALLRIRQALEKPRVMLPYTKDQKDRIKEIFNAERWETIESISVNGMAHNMALDRLEAKVREMFGIKHKECAWIKDESHGMYETSCGRAFCFINGGIKDNKMAYCPYCGKIIAGRHYEVNYDGDDPIPQDA